MLALAIYLAGGLVLAAICFTGGWMIRGARDQARREIREARAILAPLELRPGRKLSQTPGPCTLYRVTGDDWTAHECIGLVTSPELAEAVCEAVNAYGRPLAGEGASGG